MIKVILSLLLISGVASAEKLKDVRILNVKTGRDNFELKIQLRDGPPNSYFFVDITKKDPDSFEKIAHVIKKMTRKDLYKLDLDIPSFSASPSGSYYKSEGIKFSGSGEKDASSAKPRN